MRSPKIIRIGSQAKTIDAWLAVVTIAFILFGILMVFESSNVIAYRDFADKYHYVKDQFRGFILGLVAMSVVSFIPYKKYFKLSLPLMITTLILLISVFIPGIGIKAYGAHRWINLGFINFQPTELAKLVLVLYLAAWFSNNEKGRLTPFLLLLGLIIGLVMLQPDMGTAIILTSISIFLYFLSGANVMHLILLVPSIIAGGIILATTSTYRFKRLTSFLNPDDDPLGSSYHIRQILIALGSGGFTGVGLGSSLQKYEYLPEATTDSIFAIVGEEFGFLGSILMIIFFIIFLLRILRIVKYAPDKHSYLLSSGILVYFASQIVVNLGAITALIPLTGVPLPFISFGSSNLVMSMISIGILLNISKQLVKR